MPLTKLHVPASVPVETCRRILDLLHDSLVDTCGVKPDDNFALVSRYAADDMVVHPTFLGRRDVAATIFIDITLLSGRSDEQKEALYADVRKWLAVAGLPPENAIIFLTENGPIDWSFSTNGSVKKVLSL